MGEAGAGQFIFVRNQWKRTPLERIQDAIQGATNQLQMVYETVNNSMDPDEIQREQLTIDDLNQTISILSGEAAKRREKVRKLKDRRNKLIDEISTLRQEQNVIALHLFHHWERKIKHRVKQVKIIDDELGPFRWLDEPVNLG